MCSCLPSAQADTPFYAEWWFLLVLALSCLIVVLLAAFALVLRGQSRRYRSCGTGGLPCRGWGGGSGAPLWGRWAPPSALGVAGVSDAPSGPAASESQFPRLHSPPQCSGVFACDQKKARGVNLRAVVPQWGP